MFLTREQQQTKSELAKDNVMLQTLKVHTHVDTDPRIKMKIKNTMCSKISQI